MKRRLSQSLLFLLIASAAGLLAFGPRPHMDAPPGRVRIQYWEKWVGHEGEQIKQVVDTFNATVGAQKGIWVDLVSMSEIEKKTLISTAGGVPPDVAGLFDTQICQFASKGALEPLDDYATPRGLTRDYFKKVFYDGCTYGGHLYAVPSTPWAPALFWNKQIFIDKAADLRAAGLDPDRPPNTIQELDRYAQAIDTWEPGASQGSRRLKLAGYIPLEPGWWINQTVYWFGGRIVDDTGTRLELTSPQWIATFDWIRSYSQRMGTDALNNFRSGFGQFDSPQNAFLCGQTAIEMQGPWMFSFIEKLNPTMNRWHVPPEELAREKAFADVQIGMTPSQVKDLLGPPQEVSGNVQQWPAGVKKIIITFKDDRVADAMARLLPAQDRRKYCVWGVAPFPTAVTGLENVTYAGMDTLVIPTASKHKKEAFEFLAFVCRQDQSEHLNSMHCSLSPLARVSSNFLRDHPNPYVEVFEKLVSSPNARPVPQIPTWPHLADDLNQSAQKAYLMTEPSKQILQEVQDRAQRELDRAPME